MKKEDVKIGMPVLWNGSDTGVRIYRGRVQELHPTYALVIDIGWGARNGVRYDALQFDEIRWEIDEIEYQLFHCTFETISEWERALRRRAELLRLV